jgi:NADH-quinone oxidoreductase subunit J
MVETVFWIFGVIAVLSGALCILQRNPVSAALWLVSTMFSLAGIYVLLNAQFIAMIQVLVYAGAIMVLFLFVIMLLNLGHTRSDIRGPGSLMAAVVVVGLLAVELLTLWGYTPRRLASELTGELMPDTRTMFMGGQLARQQLETHGVVGGIAAPLFQTYLVPFEITSILLLAAIVGAVVLAKRRI